PVELLVEAGIIQSVGTPTQVPADLEADWVAPALHDLQINGCDGHSFNSENLRAETVRHVVAVCRRQGIGSLCPTLITNDFTALEHGFKTLAAACASDAG